jgi:cupin 2 domain-containing protein
MEFGDLFDGLPGNWTAEEVVTTLLETEGFRLVRIVSTGQATPAGEWYVQDEAEWVLVMRGRAGLLIEGESNARILDPGAYALIPAHVRHRVEWTDSDQPTVWLALHFPGLTQPPNPGGFKPPRPAR